MTSPTTRKDKRGADRPSRARVRCAPGSAAPRRSDGQTLGELLRQLRTEHGLSTRRLAERAGVARSTIQRLERGEIRPRPSTLGWVAGAIDPDRRKEIRDQLVAAAGDELAAHSEAWSRRQVHRVNQRLQQGLVPRPVAWDRQMRLTAASDAMLNVAMVLTDKAAAMLDRPGAERLVDELINLTGQLRAESERLAKVAGVRFPGTPMRRWRGDPVDVSPYPPPLSDLRVVWRWLWAWQVREGLIRPRSARERAIAATGERERQAVRDAPEPQPARPRSITEGSRAR